MLPQERRAQIQSHLEAHGAATIRDLAAAFSVSEMTIHRDWDLMEKQGLAKKVRGGALLVGDGHWAGAGDGAAGDACVLCSKPLRPHLMMTILTADGRRQRCCCGHCGLFRWRRLDGADAVMATDSLSGLTLNALDAWYVVGARKTPCCAPSVFAFEGRDDADRFVTAYGGQTLDFSTAAAWVDHHMNAAHRHERAGPGGPP